MHQVDFLAVGKKAGDKCGDAIALRFVPPDSTQSVQVVIDAGFKEDGKALVDHVNTHYEPGRLDLAILTHPDADHINGMGEVLRGLSVKKLWLQQIGAHGGSSLPAAKAVADLIALAQQEGTEVLEVFAGAQEFGRALTILGPDKDYYEQLVKEQVEGISLAEAARKAVVAAGRSIWDRVASALGQETPFPEKEVSARNNSSTITLLTLGDRRLLFSADAGVPALERAWDYAEKYGLSGDFSFVQVSHHGSRRNASSAWPTGCSAPPVRGMDPPLTSRLLPLASTNIRRGVSSMHMSDAVVRSTQLLAKGRCTTANGHVRIGIPLILSDQWSKRRRRKTDRRPIHASCASRSRGACSCPSHCDGRGRVGIDRRSWRDYCFCTVGRGDRRMRFGSGFRAEVRA